MQLRGNKRIPVIRNGYAVLAPLSALPGTGHCQRQGLAGQDRAVMDLEQPFPAQLMNFAAFVSFLSMLIHLEKLFL